MRRFHTYAIILAAAAFALPAAAQTVSVVPETGTAVAGTASTAIANVAANDLVNGNPADLTPSTGNATISEVAPWPDGLSLDPIAGAINTTAALPAGTYNVQYQLCDLNVPPDCGVTTDTVTVSPAQAVVVAVPDSGNADAGTPSKAIVNVAANDTVNGVQATLGASGNATISKVGTWQTGLVLNLTTGALTTTAALPAGQYGPTYQLCDLNVPPNCSSATESVTVNAGTVVANPESGIADAGIPSRAILNVASNDTVNGAQATLGSSGNSTVAPVNTWQTGIVLNPANGQINTNGTVPVGTYSLVYKLCDKNNPPVCSQTTDTVTVNSGVIVPNPESGTAVAGVASRPIPNVAANDMVNGSAAVLGSSGNATVSQVNNPPWPPGIALTPSTGAVSTTVAVPPGTYSITYQLCDLNTPPDCASATDTVSVTGAVSIIANPDSGTAVAGTGSRAIPNVAINDTINGAQAKLGAGGNATVKQFNTWPAGIGLITSTGAVNVAKTVVAGAYGDLEYQLCDLLQPPDCSTATDTVTVTSSVAIVANPDSGNAVAGTASRPIANVAVNDTINGVGATLGASGNATVSPNGTWATGFSLTGATGAIKTTVATPPGVFPLIYNLCDKLTPPDCTTGIATVTVAASIVALPISGTAVAGTYATPIPNVVLKDSVNGQPATLGPSGNATVAAVGGNWSDGIALNTVSGAITTTPVVPPATYNLQYQLCDLNTPQNCNTATAALTVTPQQFTEVQASATPMGDVEFDWGRDGINCPTCNFGDGNARANWTDRQNNLWIAHLDPNSGMFVLPGANDELADTSAAFWNDYGNGPEWAFSTQNGQVVSQLVYSRYQPGQTQTKGHTGAAFATQTGFNTWTAQFLPGAYGTGNGTPGSGASNLPEGSQCNSDPIALSMFKNFTTPLQLFTEPVSGAPGTAPALLPFTSNGIGERFVPCTHQFLYQADATFGQFTFQQVFWYNMDTQVVEQLTTDATTKYSGFMFRAPDFGDNYIFFTLANHTTLQVYEQTGTNGDGSPAFLLVNQITSPDPNEIYLNSAEPFINCTPTCTTYVYSTLSKTADSQNGISVPNGLAVIALSPQTPLFNILVTANSLPPRQRLDPEYYITPNGPYIYYNSIIPQTGSTTYKNLGEWFIDTQLGAPSGLCVGSSAEGGLVPGC